MSTRWMKSVWGDDEIRSEAPVISGYQGRNLRFKLDDSAIEENLADHLILAASNDMNAPSIKKKNELERIAMASR